MIKILTDERSYNIRNHFTEDEVERIWSTENLEESLPKETEDKIEKIVYQDPLASDVHNLHTRRIGSIIAIEMHLRLPGDITLSESHTHATELEKRLRDEFGAGTHIMLHIEPVK